MLLILALNFVGHVAIRGGTILFTTSKFNSKGYVQNAAFECGEYSVINFNPEDNLLELAEEHDYFFSLLEAELNYCPLNIEISENLKMQMKVCRN